MDRYRNGEFNDVNSNRNSFLTIRRDRDKQVTVIDKWTPRETLLYIILMLLIYYVFILWASSVYVESAQV